MSRKKRASQLPFDGTTRVCPSCLTKFVYDESEVGEPPANCIYCDVPLLSEGGPRCKFRCLRCARRIVTPEGIWCTHFDRAPTPDEDSCCRLFQARAGSRRARRSK